MYMTDMKNIKDKLKVNLRIKDKEIFSRDSAIEIFEKFDFEERQAKYINNAIRTYGYTKLRVLKDALPEDVTYLDIKYYIIEYQKNA